MLHILPYDFSRFSSGEFSYDLIPRSLFKNTQKSDTLVLFYYFDLIFYEIDNNDNSSYGSSINDQLMNLILITNFLRSNFIGDIILCSPYLPYARQAGSKKIGLFQKVLDLLFFSGIYSIFSIDTHRSVKKETKFFNLMPYDVFIYFLNNMYRYEKKNQNKFKSDHFICVAPDKGAKKRAYTVSTRLNCPMIVLNKKRTLSGVHHFLSHKSKLEIKNAKLEIKNAVCILVDDIIDSGETIASAANFLKALGAKKIHAWISHGIFSPKSQILLKGVPINEIWITDSLNAPSLKFFENNKNNYPLIRQFSLNEIFFKALSQFFNVSKKQ